MNYAHVSNNHTLYIYHTRSKMQTRPISGCKYKYILMFRDHIGHTHRSTDLEQQNNWIYIFIQYTMTIPNATAIPLIWQWRIIIPAVCFIVVSLRRFRGNPIRIHPRKGMWNVRVLFHVNAIVWICYSTVDRQVASKQKHTRISLLMDMGSMFNRAPIDACVDCLLTCGRVLFILYQKNNIHYTNHHAQLTSQNAYSTLWYNNLLASSL